MSSPQRLFIAYGTIILIVGFGLGTVLGVVRMKSPAVRNLATAHVETLMQACLHLALAFAVGAVHFDSGAATAGAWLLIVGSAMQVFGVTINWINDVKDQFAERSLKAIGIKLVIGTYSWPEFTQSLTVDLLRGELETVEPAMGPSTAWVAAAGRYDARRQRSVRSMRWSRAASACTSRRPHRGRPH